MDSVVERDEAINPPLSIEEYVRRLYAENEPLLREEEAPPPASSGKPASDAVLASGYNKPRADGERRKANREFVSRTDPEATVVSRQGFGLHLAYKAHLALAGTRGQVITAALATTGAKADEHLLAELLWHHRRLAKLPATEVVADAKYGTMANYSFLHRIGIVAFIPPREHPRGPGSTWGREHFTYFREEDVFLCPVGMRMKRFARRESTQRSSYRVERGACVGCRFRERCSPWGQDRTISRFFEQELVDAARERVSSPVGRRLLCQRKVRAEGVFGLAKELHGLRRTRFRGRWRVQIQLWLTAAAMNIKRATRELRRRGPRAQPARATLAAGYPSTVGLFVPALTSLLGGALLLRSYR